MSTPLDRLLSTRAKRATVDLSPVHAAKSIDQLCSIGGKLMLTAKGKANLSAIQLAMRKRSRALDLQKPGFSGKGESGKGGALVP